MSPFDLPHDGPVHIVADDRYEVALYACNGRKYRAVRELGTQAWSDTLPEEISSDHFYMVVACIQRRKVGTRGMV